MSAPNAKLIHEVNNPGQNLGTRRDNTMAGIFWQSRVRWNFSGENSVRKYQEITDAGSGTDQAPADRVPDKPGGLMEIELFHDAGCVGFSCFRADVQKTRALLGRLAFGSQLKNLALSWSERIVYDIVFRLNGLEHGLRQLRTDIRQSLQRLTDRLHQVFCRVRLGHKPFHTKPKALKNILAFVMHAKKDGLCCRSILKNLSCSLQSV